MGRLRRSLENRVKLFKSFWQAREWYSSISSTIAVKQVLITLLYVPSMYNSIFIITHHNRKRNLHRWRASSILRSNIHVAEVSLNHTHQVPNFLDLPT
jgi:hypothetical protein